ncbi:MAG: hypothetical protein UIB31_05490 [Methanobrevibacter sp.]|nr:hypothetical protein [Methanobrevibacter sp.]
MKKIVVDILLFILMLVEYSRVYLPSEIHEIIGICLIILVLIHLILNRNYFKAIPKGKYSFKRSFMLVVNVLFIIAFSATCITGLISSQDILTFMNIGNLTTVYLHKIFAYASIIVLGMHLGVNLTKLFNKIGNLIYIGIIILGVYSLIAVDFWNHLTGNYGFSIVTGNIAINTLEYLFIILMFSVITHLILNFKNRKNN